MKALSKIIGKITTINKWISYAVLVLMMIFVGVAAASRGIGYPIIGDVELVQAGMVLIIVGALAFTEATDSHVAIGIIVDHLPEKVQKFMDILAYILTIIFCFTVVYVFIIKLDLRLSSMLLDLPLYPFKILLIVGFASWGLVAIEKLLSTIISLKKPVV